MPSVKCEAEIFKFHFDSINMNNQENGYVSPCYPLNSTLILLISVPIHYYFFLSFSTLFCSTSHFFSKIFDFPLNSFSSFFCISYVLLIVDLPIFLHYRRSTIFLQQKSSFILYLTKKFFRAQPFFLTAFKNNN